MFSEITEKIISFQEKIISFLLNPDFTGFWLFLKVIFIIASLILGIAIVVLFFVNSWVKWFILEDLVETFTTKPYGAQKTFKRWLKIEKRLETEKEDEYKLAIIEADDLLDESLTRMGYKGEDLSEKLKKVDSSIIENIEPILEAHKIRDSIVYDPDYKLDSEIARRTIEIYKKTFQDLEIF